MSEAGPTVFSVGQKFPVPVPLNEGVRLSLWDAGTMTMILQFPNMHSKELKAFKHGFHRYGIMRAPTPFPLAVLTFDFPEPLGPLTCPFNAVIEPRKRIEEYLDTSGGVKNALHLFMLDKDILKAQRMSGLWPEFILLLHDIVREQLSGTFTPFEMEESTQLIIGASQHYILSQSKIFKHERIGNPHKKT
ncbi:hypothetical protein [Geoalkalibacter halelectricus]|uniref:hypothetical protein n=1 Tax=Geoalkalibacter halelectricus TaxID=2847045 RepID=UPI00266FC9A9|nr:hypothetical protein [Geoalkalibacter halelectricus]MDO3380442.1 hypothetical protein [Geoalkalibacter halelectricus]